MFDTRYEQALVLAAQRHDGQRRKGGGIPYLTHLVHVARILKPYDPDAEIAGLLHDVLEDTCKSLAETRAVAAMIEQKFGAAVLTAVQDVSEPRFREDGTKIKWIERKKLYQSQLETASQIGLLVSAADKIHNLATMELRLAIEGPDMWKKFSGSPEQTLWFYEKVAKIIVRRLGDTHRLAESLEQQLGSLQAKVTT